MPSYTRTPVRTADFTASNGTNPETLYTWLDSFPANDTGYYVIRSNKLELDFSHDGKRGLADLTGTYGNRQYVIARIGNLSSTSSSLRWLAAYLHAQGLGATADYYRLQISQDSTTTPLTTKIFRVDNDGTPSELESINNVTWGNDDLFMFVSYDGTLEVYRDSGSGFGSTPIMTYTDGSPLTGGGPGIQINTPDLFTMDDVEMGTLSIGDPPALLRQSHFNLQAAGRASYY